MNIKPKKEVIYLLTTLSTEWMAYGICFINATLFTFSIILLPSISFQRRFPVLEKDSTGLQFIKLYREIHNSIMFLGHYMQATFPIIKFSAIKKVKIEQKV